MKSDQIRAIILDHKTKGMPGGLAPLALGDIGRQGWNVLAEDLPLPLMVLNRDALTHNSQWMRGFLAMTGAVVAPHGKTTMAPQLFQQQIDDGAWAITVATTHQMQVARDFGVARIVLANQLIGRQAIRYVLDELGRAPELDFYCLIDSLENVELLAAAARAARIGRPLQLLLEGGLKGGRTGCRDVASAVAVARAVKAAAPDLALRGVEGFEGLVWGPDPGASSAKVQAFLDFLVEIARAVDREKLFAPGEVILSAGGSAFYDLVVKTFRASGVGGPLRVLTRSGCYLTHDSTMYRERFAALRQRAPEVAGLGEAPRAAIEVWAYVQSRPEPHQAILTMGKRDIPFDPDAPVALKWYRPGAGGNRRQPKPLSPEHVVTGLNDQHGYMTVPANSPLKVGDMVGFGISHPCLAFDKWQVICVVDGDYNVVDAVKTYF
jgi:D-serine dehydratase